MTTKQRKMLQRIMTACNQLGGSLDGTATNPLKLIERQKAHMLVSKAIYGILLDHPENEQRDSDIEEAESFIKQLEALASKTYPDRQGNY